MIERRLITGCPPETGTQYATFGRSMCNCNCTNCINDGGGREIAGTRQKPRASRATRRSRFIKTPRISPDFLPSSSSSSPPPHRPPRGGFRRRGRNRINKRDLNVAGDLSSRFVPPPRPTASDYRAISARASPWLPGSVGGMAGAVGGGTEARADISGACGSLARPLPGALLFY